MEKVIAPLTAPTGDIIAKHRIFHPPSALGGLAFPVAFKIAIIPKESPSIVIWPELSPTIHHLQDFVVRQRNQI